MKKLFTMLAAATVALSSNAVLITCFVTNDTANPVDVFLISTNGGIYSESNHTNAVLPSGIAAFTGAPDDGWVAVSRTNSPFARLASHSSLISGSSKYGANVSIIYSNVYSLISAPKNLSTADVETNASAVTLTTNLPIRAILINTNVLSASGFSNLISGFTWNASQPYSNSIAGNGTGLYTNANHYFNAYDDFDGGYVIFTNLNDQETSRAWFNQDTSPAGDYTHEGGSGEGGTIGFITNFVGDIYRTTNAPVFPN